MLLTGGSNTVSVIDTKTLEVVPSVAVGSSPLWGVVNSANHEFYIANFGSLFVTVVTPVAGQSGTNEAPQRGYQLEPQDG